MISLRTPTVGPILGAFRKLKDHENYVAQRVLFGRDHSLNEQQFGILEIFGAQGAFHKVWKLDFGDWSRDFTCVTEICLPAGETYRLRAGTISTANLDSRLRDLPAPPNISQQLIESDSMELAWLGELSGGMVSEFKTPKPDQETTRFVFGSCRHFGPGKRDDRIFKAINEFPFDLDFCLMGGDQIYGDHGLSFLWFLDPVSWFFKQVKMKKLTFDHYLRHYRKAFGTERSETKRLLASIPTFMTWDDHEVFNNWSYGEIMGPRPENVSASFYEARRKAYHSGKLAYDIYQASHSPINESGPSFSHEKYWYSFSHGKCDFFFMDVRNERDKRSGSMISNTQLDNLKRFLRSEGAYAQPEGRTRVKFIMTAVPMFPDAADTSYANDLDPSDRWEGFQSQRKEILDALKQAKQEAVAKNIFFLSGDIHCSFAHALYSTDLDHAVCHHLTSSAFNWGFGLESRNFKTTHLIAGAPEYRCEPKIAPAVTKDNFCVVDVSQSDITFKIFDKDGDQVGRHYSVQIIQP